jgi:hypothetical protein
MAMAKFILQVTALPVLVSVKEETYFCSWSMAAGGPHICQHKNKIGKESY